MNFFIVLMLFAVVLSGGGCKNTSTIPAVANFDIDRYCGKWYEIARLPNWFERGMSNVTAHYSKLPDGTVKVVNSGVRNGKKVSVFGIARLRGKTDQGELEVCFQAPFWGSYRIIDLKGDYTVAVVCGRRFDHLWILARSPFVPEEDLSKILAKLRNYGFAVEKLEFTGQKSGSTVKDTAAAK